jgi:hypothetical protein
MAWGNKRREQPAEPPLAGQAYTLAFALYSSDGKRRAEVLEFGNGKTYLAEAELVEGTTFEPRHGGRLVGPFASPQEAEAFIVATTWFCGQAE